MKTGVGTRFGWFAAAHVIWSLLCGVPATRILGESAGTTCLSAAVGMLGYLVLGGMVARFRHWRAPTGKQALAAVFLPAGIAWLWAGTTALCLYGNGDMVMVAAALGLPALVLAAPSVLFLWAWMGAAGELLGAGDPRPWLAAAIFLAGLLPPLLFFLGSLLGSKKTAAA